METADVIAFTEEILHGKLHFLCSGCFSEPQTVLLSRVFIIVDLLHH